jgi:hypothetical protein
MKLGNSRELMLKVLKTMKDVGLVLPGTSAGRGAGEN